MSSTELYNGVYPEYKVKEAIIWFIVQDRKVKGNRLMNTTDIYKGLKEYFNIEVDCHSIEFIMNKLTDCKKVGETDISYQEINGKKYPN